MLRLLVWTVWVILFIPAIYLNVFKLPFRLTMTKGQMIISGVRSTGANISRTSVIGTVKDRKKPVALSIHDLSKKEQELLGSEQAFIKKYVNTGVPLDVVVGTMWMSSYDPAFPDVEPSKYSITELLIVDVLLLLLLAGMYLYLRHTAPPDENLPESSAIEQPGGF